MLTNSEAMISKKSIVGDQGLMNKNKSKNEPSSKQSSNSIPKNRKSSLPEVAKNLNMILQMVECNQEVRFTATTKSSRGLHNGTSKRRSRYIGVLGNSTRWQVLINVRGKKKYIGTFGNEKEAAIVHDFYAIGLNGLEANTNFSYDGMTVQDMIMNYFTNENYFRASEFISRV
mmetsp:Transcript_11601/g.11543  ORF Transcript_11601/g.11543 Transcript_11601/m.11543 type:complete len:173 (+) Transcript_11601:137-655(+)